MEKGLTSTTSEHTERNYRGWGLLDSKADCSSICDILYVSKYEGYCVCKVCGCVNYNIKLGNGNLCCYHAK